MRKIASIFISLVIISTMTVFMAADEHITIGAEFESVSNMYYDGEYLIFAINGKAVLCETEYPYGRCIELAENVKKVVCNKRGNALILKNNGELYAVDCGSIKESFVIDRDNYAMIMDDVSDCDIGTAHFAAVKNDGSLWTWGSNGGAGALGMGVRDSKKYEPQQILSLDVPHVYIHDNLSFAVDSDGELYIWGFDASVSIDRPYKIRSNVSNISYMYEGAYQILNDEGVHYSLRINENSGELTCYTQELGTSVRTLLDYGYITNDGQLMRWYGNVTSSDDVRDYTLKNLAGNVVNANFAWRDFAVFHCAGGDTFISSSENTNRQIYPEMALENELMTSVIEVLLTVSATLALCMYRFRMGRIALNKKLYFLILSAVYISAVLLAVQFAPYKCKTIFGEPYYSNGVFWNAHMKPSLALLYTVIIAIDYPVIISFVLECSILGKLVSKYRAAVNCCDLSIFQKTSLPMYEKLKLNPKRRLVTSEVVLSMYYAHTIYDEGDSDRAEAILKRVQTDSRVFEYDCFIRFTLLRILLETGRYEEAKDYVIRIEQLQSQLKHRRNKRAIAYIAMSNIWLEAANRDFCNAVRHFEEVKMDDGKLYYSQRLNSYIERLLLEDMR